MVHPIWNDNPTVQSGLEEVKAIIKSELRIPHPQVKEKIDEYLDASGKYLRAGLLLMLAQAKETDIQPAKLYFAASVEVLHLATLIHDDVIDEADTRRGIVTMHKTQSNRIAIYAGDYLLAYSSRLLKKGISLMEASKEAEDLFDNHIIERILAGELAQLLNQGRKDMRLKDYLKQIKGKTAFLFALSCQLGAWTKQESKRNARFAFNFGQAIGMAFQLSDDLLDYQVPESQMGKPRLQDVQNRIYTAPLLFAIEENASLREYLGKESFSVDELDRLQKEISQTAAYQRTNQLIERYLKKAGNFAEKMQLPNQSHLLIFLKKIMGRNF
ncbi:polyprenyl synthetase family protein [Streptococcus gallolyticus]|nr:polyprenyl synthetase family protein [Streptococcus gallolyticus]MBY5042067.1 polyprenyl synthetase family protein [Streptococcus gallolyticus]